MDVFYFHDNRCIYKCPLYGPVHARFYPSTVDVFVALVVSSRDDLHHIRNGFNGSELPT